MCFVQTDRGKPVLYPPPPRSGGITAILYHELAELVCPPLDQEIESSTEGRIIPKTIITRGRALHCNPSYVIGERLRATETETSAIWHGKGWIYL